MDSSRAQQDLYLLPTPAGAYYAVSRPVAATPRKLLRNLLQRDVSPLLTMQGIQELSGVTSEAEATMLLKRLQKQGWVQGTTDIHRAPQGNLATLLPAMLAPLSGNGKVLLADYQGFFIAGCGFDQEKVEEISALSADLASLQDRHMKLLTRDLDMSTSAWALVDAAGNSQLGFWPLYIGEQRFVLAVEGLPCLNQQVLVELIWALTVRYGAIKE